MKTTILTLLGVLLYGGVSAQQTDPQVITCYEGDKIEHLVLNGAFEVEVRQGTPTALRMEIAPGVSPDTVSYKLENGMLKLGWKLSPLPGTKNIMYVPIDHDLPSSKAIITVDDLKSIKNNGPHNVRLVNVVASGSLAITNNANPDLVCLNISAVEAIVATDNGRGKIDLTIDKTPEVTLTVNGSGQIVAAVDSVRNLFVKNNGMGTVSVSGIADSVAYRSTTNQGTIDLNKLKVAHKTTPKQQSYDYKMEVFPFYTADVVDVKSGKSYQMKVRRLLSGNTTVSGDGDDVQMAFRELLLRLSSPTDTKEVSIKNGEVIKKGSLLEIKNAEGEVLYRHEGK